MSASQQASHHRPVNEGYLTIKIQFAPGKSKNSVIVHCGRAYCKTSLNGCFFIFPPPFPGSFSVELSFDKHPPVRSSTAHPLCRDLTIGPVPYHPV